MSSKCWGAAIAQHVVRLGYGFHDLGNVIRFPVGTIDSSSTASSGRHAASYSIRAGISDWWEKRPGTEIYHARLVSRLRMRRAVSLLPPVFLPHGLHRDNLTANLVPGAFNLRPSAK